MIRLVSEDSFDLDKELTISLTKGELMQIFSAMGTTDDLQLMNEVAEHFGDSVALALNGDIDSFQIYTDIKEILRREGTVFV